MFSVFTALGAKLAVVLRFEIADTKSPSRPKKRSGRFNSTVRKQGIGTSFSEAFGFPGAAVPSILLSREISAH